MLTRVCKGKKIRLLASTLCLLAFLLPGIQPLEAKESKGAQGAIWVASDGKGQVQLFWLPPAEKWPVGGWRLEEVQSGRVLQPRIAPGEAELLKSLSEEDAETIREFNDTLAKAPAEEKQLLLAFLGASAMRDWTYARALGLAWTLHNVPGGERSYRVIGLDKAGQPTGVIVTSEPVDASVATPPPHAPPDLRAEAQQDRVALFWSPVPTDPKLPVIAYYVERDGAGRTGVAVTSTPVILGVRWDPKVPALVDAKTPVEQELIYRVYSVDLFGRKSPPASVKFFFPDLSALIPPEPVTATAGVGRVVVEWKGVTNPHTAGHVVERAYLHSGPYEVLTPKGLRRDVMNYEDTDVRGGTAYYYRVRAMGPRGDLGHPSRAAMAQPQYKEKPPRPEGLKAEAGRSRVRLTWEAVKVPVAGFFIERRAEGADRWARLNSDITPEPLYDDYFGAQTSGRLSYRIVAVAFDNQESEPSKAVEVSLPDTRPPSAPHITGIDGGAGKVTLTFTPALPAEDTHQFLVLRGGSPDDPGLVIGDPLSANARKFEDSFVQAGQDYWYRLVAVNRSGNRGDPSSAVAVRVGSASIPTPRKPKVQFVSQPFPHVEIRFDPPPPGPAVMVQSRSGEKEPWVALAGPIRDATQAIDANPPAKGKVQYRIVYQAENGVQGPPSEAAEISRPGS